ncbi:MAG TPA: PEP-CTERM-box response regulator transcription factor [Povalibacter sp.]|uniref:PEP-CTERM-box response regulator transcription factor n=1 Tax=Povalibacter sp. TaxID=1962978 RepID=UPI002CCC4BAD|nr:PEP-CTERM-box response regulator transcription factor [Povalibacter sp.]HMN42955.1 PEP-CTERM-box response regulator transcription factor [Povalibacter sp.]
MNDTKPRLLIVEDDAGLQRQLKWCFDDHEVLMASTRNEAIAQLRRFEPPVVLQDLGLPPDLEGVGEGMATLKEILNIAPQTKVIVVTGNHDRDNAVTAVSLGAYDFYEKPVDTDVLRLLVSRAFNLHALEQQNRQLREAQYNTPFQGLIATDEAMLKVCRMVEKVAPADVSVLILGESGTGKELLARAVHNQSAHTAGRFVAINCAAIPEQLLESELFGHEKGAFTGAVKQTLGKVEMANSGTLFLDEIGDMPLALQAKLLRFLQGRVIERVGGREEIPVNVRVVCATNKDLQAQIAAQQFRQDLFFRIGEVTINVPPLRDRPGAATVLAHSLLRKFGGIHGRPKRGFTEEAIAALEAYEWPGNVRELENKVKTAMIMAEGTQITAEDLGLREAVDGTSLFNLKEVRARAERQAIRQTLIITDGNISRTAEMIGVSRPTLYDLMEKYGIRSPQ